MRVALLVSVSINFCLIAGIGIARVDSSRPAGAAIEVPLASDTFPSGAAAPLEPGVELRAESLTAYYESLRARGFTRRETRRPLAGWIMRTLATTVPSRSAYWSKEDPVFATAELTRRNRLEDALRRELVDLYGPEVASYTVFTVLFHPLGHGFEFMSSADQIALTRWRRSRGARRAGDASTAGVAGRQSGCRGPDVSGGAAAQPPLPPSFDESVRFEYALRASPLAERLRRFDLDETTFRAAFREAEPIFSARSLEARSVAEDRLRSVLGEARADALLAAFDPEARMLQSVAVDGLGPRQLADAYRVIADTRQSIAKALSSAPARSAAAVGKEVSGLKDRERQALETLLGPESSRRFFAARERSALDRVGKPAC